MTSLQAGTVVGRYRVGPPIGAGGMGEVYEATDTQLGRRVALKVLRRSDQVERFVREARAASALGHPAIVAVYDAGEAALDDGNTIAFLAMERIDGEPFSKWLRGRRDERSVLDVLAQVADGLAIAHANGIVHRDLKPENIVVTRDGYAKIVDFGAAKLAVSSDQSTADGALVGTPAYMAPEQLDGTDVDHRADVFALGCVLYEALSGRSPFRGATPVDTMHAILHADAPALSADPELQRIVRRCLQKDREQRYQSIRDLALDLRELGTFRASSAMDRRRPRRLQYSIAGAALVALLLLAAFLTQGDAPPAPAMQMQRITNSGQVVTNAISPDGNYLVYVTYDRNQQGMWVRQVATGQDVRILPPAPVAFMSVRVSPDNSYVYYAQWERSETNILDIYRVPIVGGTPVKVVSDFDEAAAISPDGRQILFRRFNAIERRDRIYIADVDTGTEQFLFERRFPERVYSLTWHPDGQSIIYTGLGKDKPPKPVTRIYEMRLADRSLREIPTPEFLGIRSLTWLPDGSGMIVTAFDREQPSQVWFLPKDGRSAKRITSDISGYSDVTVTADGNTIVARRGEGSANLWLVDLDRPREPRALTTGTANYHGQAGVRWLADGRILYVSVGPLRAGERKMGPMLFTTVADRFEPQPLIRNVPAWNPAVSADGRRVAFSSDTSGPVEIWTVDTAGTNLHQATHLGRAGLPSFSPDGNTLYCISTGEHQAAWKVPLTGGATQRLTSLPANEASISPHGDQILCRLRSPKKIEGIPLWRTAVIPLAGGPPRFYPVPEFGGPPRLTWHPSGDAFLFVDYVEGVGNLWQQDLAGGPPRQITFFDSGEICAFDLSQDGKRIVVSRGTSSTDAVMIRGFR